MRTIRQTTAAVLLPLVVLAPVAFPAVAQTSTHNLHVLQRDRRTANDQRECSRQCRPLHKECMTNCERTGQVPGVTTRSGNCRDDCSTLISQCLEECAKRQAGFSVLIPPGR